MTCKHSEFSTPKIMTIVAAPYTCIFCHVEKLEAEVAPLRAYRVAYFAHYAEEMRWNREYERKKKELDNDAFDVWSDSNERDHVGYSRMRDAECALTAEEHWPEDYKKLVAEMKEEFGDE